MSPFELEEMRRVVDTGQGIYPGDAVRLFDHIAEQEDRIATLEENLHVAKVGIRALGESLARTHHGN